MKRTIQYSILWMVLGCLSISCTSWLDEEAKSSILTKQYYETPEDAEAAVIGIYHYSKVPFNKYGYDQVPYAMLEVVTGLYDNQAQWSFGEDYMNLKYDASNSDFLSWWENYFKGIEAANLAIENVPGVLMDENEKNKLLAEAYFLRAYFYYNLVNIFGDIPMKTTPTSGPEDSMLPKSSVKEIYENVIIPDLLFAEKQPLYTTTEGNGRVSTGAVQTLLAKAYLSMAGALGQTDKYALAKEKAGEVIKSGNYNLFQTTGSLRWFDKLNNPSYDNKEEHIWMANFAITNQNNLLPMYFLPKEVDLTGALQFGGFYPKTSFLQSYDAADLRGMHNQGFFFNEIEVNDVTYNFPWAIYKFFDPGIINTAPNSGKNFPIFRYADVLLMYAEAQNEADGAPDAEAYTAINAIRERAGLAPISNLNKTDFQAEVWKQRYWELCAECKIWFDIVRTKRIFDPVSGTFKDAVGFTMPNGAVFQESNLTFPVPAREVQINPLLDK